MRKIFSLLLLVIVLISCNNKLENELIDTDSLESTFVDNRDGKSYKCITIGTQTWMAENLKYRLPLGGFDGCVSYNEKPINIKKVVVDKKLFKDSLKVAKDRNEVDAMSATYLEMLFLDDRNQATYSLSLDEFLKQKMNETYPTYADFFEEILPVINRINQNLLKVKISQISLEYTDYEYVKKYGYLYSYEAAQKAIPDGWKLPTDEDWKILEKHLGIKNDSELNKLEKWRGSTQGKALKNSSKLKFYAQMAGAQAYGITSGHAVSNYINIGVKSYYWTDTEGEPVDSLKTNIIRALQYNNDKIYRGTSVQDSKEDNKRVYYSVRCVKK